MKLTIAPKCYKYMFNQCGRITAAPVLPAESLPTDCYNSMFYYVEESGRAARNGWVKCLANDSTGATTNWLKGASGLYPVFVKKDGATWATGDSGIPSGWNVRTV